MQCVKQQNRMAWRRRRACAGMGLIELSCALFVVTVGIFGIIELYTLGLDKTKATQEYTIAQAALDNELESLRAVPFDALQDGPAWPFRSATPTLEKLIQAKGSVSIKDCSGDTRGLKEVEVRLRWKGEHGRIIEKRMTTLIARKQ